MSQRKMPGIDSQGAHEFCKVWDSSTHAGKLALCQKYKVNYQKGKDFRTDCRIHDLPPVVWEAPQKSWEEHIDTMLKMDELVSIHQYVPTEIAVKVETDEPIGVVFTADWQLGQFGVDLLSFKRDMNTIHDEPDLRTYIGGDGYENIIQPSKMGSSHDQTPIPVQRGLYYLTLKKLTDKIIAVGTGNHNYWSALMEGEDWDRELCNRLKLVYTKHAGVLLLTVGNQVYPILRMHKSRFQSAFNLTHTCKQYQRMHFPDARIVVAEDKHVAAIEQYRYNENECIAIRTGTYAVYDDYALREGFYGNHVANPTVVLYPNENRVVGFKDMYEALVYLKGAR